MGGRGSGRKTKIEFIPATDRDVWERQPEESDPAWEAFCLYRDAGLPRTLEAVRKQLKKSLTLMGNWSSRWGWRMRVEAWDRKQDDVHRGAILEAKRKASSNMVKRHLKFSTNFQRLVEVELARWINKVGANGNNPDLSKAPELTPDQLQKLLDYAVKLERLNRDEPGEITENRVKGGESIEDIERRITHLLKAR